MTALIYDPQPNIKCSPKDIGKYVLLPGDPARVDLIASYLDHATLIANYREHRTFTGWLSGEKVSVTSTGMGCPSTAIAVEELINCGADTFIRVGTAGKVCDASYDSSIDGIICYGAVRDEGTSLQYIPIEYPAVADREVVQSLVMSAKQLGYNYPEGLTQSKDSFYGQHEPENMPVEYYLRNRWEAWRRGHVMCSEMESSLLFVLASIRGLRAASIMSFGDIDKTIETAISAIKILIDIDKQKRRS